MKKRLEPLPPGEIFKVEYYSVPRKSNMPASHYHNCYEIYYFLGDEMTYFIDNKSFHIRKYDVIFIDKFTYHKTWYLYNTNLERYLIYISEEAFSKVIKDPDVLSKIYQLFKIKKISLPESFNQSMLQDFNNKIYPASNPNATSIEKLKAMLSFFDILLSIIDMIEKGIIEKDDSFPNSKEQRVSQIVNYINANYSKDISLDFLAKRFYINKYYLCHIFKEVTGLSVVDFIIKKRLVEAEKLLRYTSYSITQISQFVGFNNVNHFITQFKKRYNCTPRAFREEIR